MRVLDLLRSLDASSLPRELQSLFARIDDNFQNLKKALGNRISLSDNIQCDVVTAQFDSGKPTRVTLRNIKTARSAILLGSTVPVFGAPVVTADGVTMYFAQNAKSVVATVALFEEGTLGKLGSLLATTTEPGLVRPDGVTTNVNNGVLSATAGGVTLATGADGTVLTARSTAPYGLAWESGGPFSLARRPLLADPRDEEFEATAYSGWTDVGTRSATAIDVYAAFNTANTFRSSWNSYRASWWMFQPTYSNNNVGLLKPVTLNTNDFIYARVFTGLQGGVLPTNGNGSVRIVVGNAAFAAYVVVATNLQNAGVNRTIKITESGGGDLFITLPNGHAPVAYIGMHKIGNDYHGWYATDDGIWQYIGKVTNAVAVTQVQIYGSNNGAPPAAMGCPILGFDFLRFLNTATNLP